MALIRCRCRSYVARFLFKLKFPNEFIFSSVDVEMNKSNELFINYFLFQCDINTTRQVNSNLVDTILGDIFIYFRAIQQKQTFPDT